MMNALSDNQKRWEKLEAAEQAEETQTELSDAAEPEEISEADEETRGSSETLLLPSDFIPRRQSLAVPVTENLCARRHSMPVATGLALPRTIIRRESLPPSRFALPEVRLNSRASSSHIREEDELRFGSQSSLLSSNSGGQDHSSVEEQERPLSAENLLPEPSIASITSSAAADKLSSVMQGGFVTPTTKCLTRQQTFPPLQPYVRIRYMSTTAEMAKCSGALIEGGSKSNSSNSSHENVEKSAIPTITILSPNNCRSSEVVSSDSINKVISSCNNKREPEALEKEKATKIAKLSDTGQRYEKENLDPRKFTPPGLNIRRGSAPMTMSLVRPEDSAPSAGGGPRAVERLPRRGSMPIDVSQQASEPRVADPAPQVDIHFLRAYGRRGSAPADPQLVHPERRDLLTRHTSLNGKASRRKKQLRRRSSGGPETVCAQEVLGADVWHRLKRDLSRRSDNADLLLDRRRGSLPIEMLTFGHSVC